VSPSHKPSVLLLAIGSDPVAGIMRTALRNGWAVRRADSAGAGYRELLRDRPNVAVVQISPVPTEELKLIRRVRADLLPMAMIAVSSSPDDETERAVRIAGVDGYLSGAAAAILLERAAAELLARYDDAGASPRAGKRPERHDPRGPLHGSAEPQRCDAEIAPAASPAQPPWEGPHGPGPSVRSAQSFVIRPGWKLIRRRAAWRGRSKSWVPNDGTYGKGDSK